MSNDNVTRPTIETVLERLAALEERLDKKLDERTAMLDERISALDGRLHIRLDRIEGIANTTRGEMLDLRADFKELRNQLREHFPALS